MTVNLTQEEADQLVRDLGIDNDVDDYELVEGTHNYFLAAPLVLQIFSDGTARMYDVDQDQDTDNVRTVGLDWGVLEYTVYAAGQAPTKVVRDWYGIRRDQALGQAS